MTENSASSIPTTDAPADSHVHLTSPAIGRRHVPDPVDFCDVKIASWSETESRLA